MSEYQYVGFRAVDGPVSEKNLEYMRRQSSRAEISPWSFENEYHYGDFRGNAVEMLRLGYDFHLHYANFGIRTLLIRLPSGWPDSQASQPYLIKESLEFLKDKRGPGGCLSISPYYEPGDLEDFWEVDTLLDQLVPLREEILNGDLRPLYLAHLAVSLDNNHDPEETYEAPVPAGLENLSPAQHALAEFYGLNDALIAAAVQKNLSIPKSDYSKHSYEEWIRLQPETVKDAWLSRLMADSGSSVRTEMMASYRADLSLPAWPTTHPARTIAQLEAAAEEITRKAQRQAATKAAQQRKKRLIKMAENPTETLRETERLVALRSSVAYRKIAELLSDLRESLAGSHQSDLAEKGGFNFEVQ